MVVTANREVHEVVQPVLELLQEYRVDGLPWVGVRLAESILESV